MSRLTAFISLASVLCGLAPIAGAQDESPGERIVTLAQRQALELAGLRVRYAYAVHTLAEAELQAALEEYRSWPGTVSASQVQRLRAVEQASRVAVRMAELANRPEETAKELLRLSLMQRTNVRFQDVPLKEFVDALGEKFQINVIVDHKALDNAGLGEDVPVSIHLQDATLQTALRTVLKPLDLTFLIENEALLITTVDEAGQRLYTEIYDVYDLLVWDSIDRQVSPGNLDYTNPVQFLTGTVAPTTWDSVGGPGSIQPMLGMLVISQTEEVHEQIRDVLTRLRKVRLSRTDRIGLFKVLEALQ